MSTGAAEAHLGATFRRDRWWVPAVLTAVGLSAFGIYSAIVIIWGADYLYMGSGAHYLSPFYSPDLESILHVNVPFSPAFLVVWAPLGLRLTCYYYRKAYYRAFFMAPPGCAVRGTGRKYTGEARLPFVLQNVHRYFLYFATIVLAFLWYDTVRAFFFRDSGGGLELGLGLGTLIMLANVLFLTFFTFGCNSMRHLVGGCLDCFAAHRERHRLWRGVTRFNVRHMEWAWISLCSVGLTDLYVRLAASGVFHDPRIF